jgi:ADP-dependent NAD(P)H-hydrate dehydratase / NAD(P)H-hydrate epimerase
LELVKNDRRRPIYSLEQSLGIFAQVSRQIPAYEFVERSGAALADLVMAVSPHANEIWLVCGPGRYGSYGLEAAKQLKQAGKSPTVTRIETIFQPADDNRLATQRAQDAGVKFQSNPPTNAHLYVDTLSTLDCSEPPHSEQSDNYIRTVNAGLRTVISLDLPSGLQWNTGQVQGQCVKATHTLSLLTLKPGLYLAHGRDAVGTVWLTDLGFEGAGQANSPTPAAWMMYPSSAKPRAHDTHKGTYGDVAVVGGADGMVGAAFLAGTAALHSGAGRVVVYLVGREPNPRNECQPALMVKGIGAFESREGVVVCGCGGGLDLAGHLRSLLKHPGALVLDADALNAIARDRTLANQLKHRAACGFSTVLTPHPLEAARLLNSTVQDVQSDRLQAALDIAQQYHCVSVLKGAGTVVAHPEETPYVCPSGNAKLATAGTGDVLAGMIGANLAQGSPALEAALVAVFNHGHVADNWPASCALTADLLARHPNDPPSALCLRRFANTC